MPSLPSGPPASRSQSRRPEAVSAFQRTADRIRGHFASVVEQSGITLQQYQVLRIVGPAGSAGMPTLAIASRMVERAPGITRLLDRLERQELVARIRGTDDRRQVVCRITAKGVGTLASLDGAVRQAEDTTLRTLTDNEVGALIHLLDRVRASLS